MNEKDCVILLFSKKIRRVFVKCRMINTLSENRISASNKNECIVLIYETLVMLTKKYIINSVIFLIDYLYFDFLRELGFCLLNHF